MRRLIRFLVLIAVLAAVAYFVRRRLVPDPEMPIVDPPRFRVAPHEPEAPVVAVAAPEVPSGDDLTAIHGIGPVYAMRLHDRGITTFAELAAADGAQVADAIDVPRSRLDDWIEEAGSRS